MERRTFFSTVFAASLGLLGIKRPSLRLERDLHQPQIVIKSRLYKAPTGLWVVAWEGDESVELVSRFRPGTKLVAQLV